MFEMKSSRKEEEEGAWEEGVALKLKACDLSWSVSELSGSSTW